MRFYSREIASFVCLFYLVGGSSSWAADPTVAARVISEAGAQQELSAAEHEAEALHAPCAIAVVDTSGVLVAFLKMDGVRAGSPDLAIGKARTSALLQRPSAETESAVRTHGSARRCPADGGRRGGRSGWDRRSQQGQRREDRASGGRGICVPLPWTAGRALAEPWDFPNDRI
jgi:hypothetical protein